MKIKKDTGTGKKLPKKITQEEYDLLVENGMADLVSPPPPPKERPAPTEAQLERIKIRQSVWLQFKFALVFRVWRAITGEMPGQPPKGDIDVNGRPKNGTLPQDYILKHLGYEIPLEKAEHRTAYAIIAEMYSVTDPEARPDGKLWESLMSDKEALVDKWCGAQDPFLNMSFPDALKTARMDLRWTQGNLADEIRYQSLAVSRWERGEYEPSPQAVWEIANRMPRMKLWFKMHTQWLKDHNVPAI